jgi:hypothetical protein
LKSNTGTNCWYCFKLLIATSVKSILVYPSLQRALFAEVVSMGNNLTFLKFEAETENKQHREFSILLTKQVWPSLFLFTFSTNDFCGGVLSKI